MPEKTNETELQARLLAEKPVREKNGSPEIRTQDQSVKSLLLIAQIHCNA